MSILSQPYWLRRESSPYDRANKRAVNYGTLAQGSTTEAAVNAVMISALNSKNSAAVEQAIQIIYAQAATRYARLLDIDVTSTPPLSTDDHRAEVCAIPLTPLILISRS